MLIDEEKVDVPFHCEPAVLEISLLLKGKLTDGSNLGYIGGAIYCQYNMLRWILHKATTHAYR